MKTEYILVKLLIHVRLQGKKTFNIAFIIEKSLGACLFIFKI